MTNRPDVNNLRRLAQVGVVSIIGWGLFGLYKIITWNKIPSIESHHKVVPAIKNILITNGIADTTFLYDFKVPKSPK